VNIPAGGFHEFLTGMLILPTAVAWVFLTAVFFIVPTGINPVWQIIASFFPAAVFSYLAVVKGMFRPAFSGWFVTGALLFALLFSFIYSAFWWKALAVLIDVPEIRMVLYDDDDPVESWDNFGLGAIRIVDQPLPSVGKTLAGSKVEKVSLAPLLYETGAYEVKEADMTITWYFTPVKYENQN